MTTEKSVVVTKKTKKAAFAIAGIAGAAALVGAGCAAPSGSQNAAPGGSQQQGDAGSAPTSNASYKDGTYEALGDYRSPGGPEQIDVKLTLKDNVVTSLSVVPQATRPRSVHYQGLFVSGVNDQVVGKNINEVNLTWVSGSSLTPRGFNDALAKIKTQASS